MKKLKQLILLLYFIIFLNSLKPSLIFYQTNSTIKLHSKFQILLNLSTRPLHLNTTQTRPRLHDFVKRKPLLGPRLRPLFRCTLRPHLRPERLGVRHVVRAVRVRPEKPLSSTRALGWRYRRIGPCGMCKTRGALRGATFEFVAREAPLVVLKAFAVGDGDAGGNWTWERG